MVRRKHYEKSCSVVNRGFVDRVHGVGPMSRATRAPESSDQRRLRDRSYARGGHWGGSTVEVVTPMRRRGGSRRSDRGQVLPACDGSQRHAELLGHRLEPDGCQTFQKGKKYTLSVWLKSKSGTATGQHQAGTWSRSVGRDTVKQQVTMTDTWAEYSVTTRVFAADVTPASLTLPHWFCQGGILDGCRAMV